MTDRSSDWSSGSGTSAATGSRTITAFFDSRTDAEEAVARLKTAGLPADQIRLVEGSASDGTARERSADRTYEAKGFWESLADLFMPDDDRSTYAEGLSRGGYLVTVTGASGALYEQALDILDDEGTVDMDERSAAWRSEGWSGYRPETDATMREKAYGAGSQEGSGFGAKPTPGSQGLMTGGSGLMGSDADRPGLMTRGTTEREANIGSGSGPITGASSGVDTSIGQGSGLMSGSGRNDGVSPSHRTDATAGGSTDTTRGFAGERLGERDGEEVLPVVEERLNIGKRDVSHGRVRVRSYVVEQPVSQQVTLENERVTVDRRAVDRPLGAGEDMFRDRVIEAEERTEEPVVSKEARVTEEVRLGREHESRQQTVSDTVRKTEVEVEDERDRGMTDRGTGTRRDV